MPVGALLVLHVDTEAAANRLASDVLPRLAARFIGKTPLQVPAPAPPNSQVAVKPGEFVRLGSVNARIVSALHQGRDVLVAWGDDTPAAVQAAAADPRCSAATLCTGWEREAKGAPQRSGAFWPARSWAPPAAGGPTPAWEVLAGDPPVLWWGWNDRDHDRATDSIRWPGLKNRSHRFLEKITFEDNDEG